MENWFDQSLKLTVYRPSVAHRIPNPTQIDVKNYSFSIVLYLFMNELYFICTAIVYSYIGLNSQNIFFWNIRLFFSIEHQMSPPSGDPELS